MFKNKEGGWGVAVKKKANILVISFYVAIFNFTTQITREEQVWLFYFRKHVKEFLDLRGCRWAYSDENSLSASTVILKTLKEQGENASFFGNTLSEYTPFSTLKTLKLTSIYCALFQS